MNRMSPTHAANAPEPDRAAGGARLARNPALGEVSGEAPGEALERSPFERPAQLLQLPLECIRLDGGTQSRAALDDRVVAEYADAMDAGARFPPVPLFYDGQDYWPPDGFHRLAATRRRQEALIDVEVRQGTQRDALRASLRANATHGLPRSSADKRRAMLRAFADEEWQTWTDRGIADLCGVSAKTVATLRAELIASGYLLPSRERTVFRQEKPYRIQTERIRAANASRRRAAPEDVEDDQDEDEDVGEGLPKTEADVAAGDPDAADAPTEVGLGDVRPRGDTTDDVGGDVSVDVNGAVHAMVEAGTGEGEDVTGQVALLLRADLWQPFAQQAWRIVAVPAAPALHPAFAAAAVSASPLASPGYWAVAPTHAARVPYAQPAATPAELERALWTVWEAEKAFAKGGDPGRRPWPLTRVVAHAALTPDLRVRGWTLYERKGAWWMQTWGTLLRAWRDRTTPNVSSAERAVADARALERLERLGWELQGNTREGWWARKGFWSIGQPRPDERTARCATWTEVAAAAVTLAHASVGPATPTLRLAPLAPMVLWAPEQTAAYTLPPLTRYAVRYHTVREGLVTTVRGQRLPDDLEGPTVVISDEQGAHGEYGELGAHVASAGRVGPPRASVE